MYEFSLQGLSRKYLVYSPKNLKRPSPLVLFLHGTGGDAQNASTKYGWVEKADKESFIVAFPEATPLHKSQKASFLRNPTVWNDGSNRGQTTVDDITFLKKVIDEISQDYLVDQKKIYMTGFSNGASMTFRAGVELSDMLAAIAPVSGHLWLKNPKLAKPIPLLLIAGSDDPLNPLRGGDAKTPWRIHLGDEKSNYRPPIETSVKKWAELNNLLGAPKITIENRVTIEQFGPGEKNEEVVFITIEGQGHEWPGSERVLPHNVTGPAVESINATDTIWSFFKKHPILE